MKRIIPLSLTLIMIISCLVIPTTARARTYTNTKGSVKVVCGSYKKTFKAKDYKKNGKPNLSRALETALKTAGKKASAKKIAKVTLSKGNYTFDRAVRLYSNTELIATGCYLRNQKKDNILSVIYTTNNKKVKGYNGFKNITVTGGCWDAQVSYSKAASKTGQHSTMRFGHCSNIVVRKATFLNNYNAHDIEFVGVKGIKVYSCKFKNTKNVNKLNLDGGLESIQLDVCHKKSAPNMLPYDGTTCKNVYIYKNTFTNKYRAVGSHHAVAGNTYDNINVYNNTMDNIAGIAVNAVYWTNSRIYNNTLKSVGSGIDFCAFSDHNIYNTNKLTFTQIKNSLMSSETFVYGNKISVRSTNNSISFKFGIRATGADCSTTNKNENVPKKIYKCYGVYVGSSPNDEQTSNDISGPVNAGVALVNAESCEATNNTISLNSSNKNKDVSFGLFVVSCDSVRIEGNTAKHTNADTTSVRDGMTIRGSKNVAVWYNTFKVSDYGVQMLNGCDEVDISGNIISSSRLNCVYLSGKDDPTPDVRKSLVVTNNSFNSKSASKEDAAISVLLSTTDLTAEGNINASIAIRGRNSTRTTMLDNDDMRACDMWVGKSYYFPEAGAVKLCYSLRWSYTGNPQGYYVYREEDSVFKLLTSTSDTYYTDEYEFDGVFLYRIVPYIMNDSVTLLGSPCDALSETNENA